ncbi:type II toxin-antitoxin system RelE/ParE family toxin [uncultured Microbulbifer sp.]|uniref:type II toxin-antitoxin system RelE/ParE family toxin n=1 Tax=uncultured Microbulbifer sp. TaxID=348147 RepID=UPI0025ED4306|nr:type II toxin-antitoxin system RelE/ParE family toxin [uncultured Microbulbifer sp.]
MDREIIWLPEAVTDLMRLRSFIQQENPEAAKKAARRIQEAIKILQNNPEAGRPVEEAMPFRDLVIPFGSGNYIVRYRETVASLVIVRLRHSRENTF